MIEFDMTTICQSIVMSDGNKLFLETAIDGLTAIFESQKIALIDTLPNFHPYEKEQAKKFLQRFPHMENNDNLKDKWMLVMAENQKRKLAKKRGEVYEPQPILNFDRDFLPLINEKTNNTSVKYTDNKKKWKETGDLGALWKGILGATIIGKSNRHIAVLCDSKEAAVNADSAYEIQSPWCIGKEAHDYREQRYFDCTFVFVHIIDQDDERFPEDEGKGRSWMIKYSMTGIVPISKANDEEDGIAYGNELLPIDDLDLVAILADRSDVQETYLPISDFFKKYGIEITDEKSLEDNINKRVMTQVEIAQRELDLVMQEERGEIVIDDDTLAAMRFF